MVTRETERESLGTDIEREREQERNIIRISIASCTKVNSTWADSQ